MLKTYATNGAVCMQAGSSAEDIDFDAALSLTPFWPLVDFSVAGSIDIRQVRSRADSGAFSLKFVFWLVGRGTCSNLFFLVRSLIDDHKH